jgi:bifunctional UDP-N-acetylglucosamine pyrophosphorylase/glucosamine-1-phosphate N-acetyltransferase
MTTTPADPTGYGRIIRNPAGNLERIVEHRDATLAERSVAEINAGIYCFEIQPLLAALEQLSNNNAQGEYYLTDVPGILLRQGHQVGLAVCPRVEEVLGINTRVELAACEQQLRQQSLERLMLGGVTIIDPNSTYIAPEVEIGRDTVIHPQVIIEGVSRLGAGCEVHSWSHLTDVELGDRVVVKNCCVVVASALRDDVSVGGGRPNQCT